MPRDEKKRHTGCPVAYAMDIFGDRWSLLVIRDMLFFGKRRYSELAASGEQIASNILADRLKKLEADGLIHRRRDPEDRRQVFYELTEKGRDLTPAMLEIIRWSSRHDKNTATPKAFLERIENDREALIEEIRRERKT